jgi:hypothetical protein
MSISRIAVVAVTLLVTIIVFSGVQVFAQSPAPPSNLPNPTSAQHQEVKKQHHGTTEHKSGGPGNAEKAPKGSTELK